jgi:hypothetical protein
MCLLSWCSEALHSAHTVCFCVHCVTWQHWLLDSATETWNVSLSWGLSSPVLFQLSPEVPRNPSAFYVISIHSGGNSKVAPNFLIALLASHAALLILTSACSPSNVNINNLDHKRQNIYSVSFLCWWERPIPNSGSSLPNTLSSLKRIFTRRMSEHCLGTAKVGILSVLLFKWSVLVHLPPPTRTRTHTALFSSPPPFPSRAGIATSYGLDYCGIGVRVLVRKALSDRMSRPITLWGIEAPTFSRQSAHRWEWCCQPKAPVAPYPLGIFLVRISVTGWVDGSTIVRLTGLGKLKNPSHRDSKSRHSGL